MPPSVLATQDAVASPSRGLKNMIRIDTTTEYTRDHKLESASADEAVRRLLRDRHFRLKDSFIDRLAVQRHRHALRNENEGSSKRRRQRPVKYNDPSIHS